MIRPLLSPEERYRICIFLYLWFIDIEFTSLSLSFAILGLLFTTVSRTGYLSTKTSCLLFLISPRRHVQVQYCIVPIRMDFFTKAVFRVLYSVYYDYSSIRSFRRRFLFSSYRLRACVCFSYGFHAVFRVSWSSILMEYLFTLARSVKKSLNKVPSCSISP